MKKKVVSVILAMTMVASMAIDVYKRQYYNSREPYFCQE